MRAVRSFNPAWLLPAVLLCAATCLVPQIGSAQQPSAAPADQREAEFKEQLKSLPTDFPVDAAALAQRLIELFPLRADVNSSAVALTRSRDLFETFMEYARGDAAVLSSDSSHPCHRSGAVLWLLQNAPPIDLLELDRALLEENITLAFADAERFAYDPASDFFRRYVLNYRLDDEPVTAWRAELVLRYPPAQSRNVPQSEVARDLATRVGDGFSVLERGYFGNQADPISIDNARAGTKSEFALLLAAALRSAGFATRFVREGRTGESWVEVHIADEGWQPLYPGRPEQSFQPQFASELCGGRITVVTAGDAFGREQVTARYSPVGELRPFIERDNAVAEGYEHFSISAWHSGRWVPLDDLEFPLSGMDYPLSAASDDTDAEGGGPPSYWLGPGEYRLTAGARYPGGYVQVATLEFTVSDRFLAQPSVDLTAPTELPTEALVERRLEPALFTGELAWLATGVQLVLISDDSEPSVRAKEIFDGIELPAEGKHFYGPAEMPEGSALASALGYSPGGTLPLLILLRDGETLLYLQGYNLNAGEWIMRALEQPGS